MDQLPLVLLLQIAEYSVDTWRALVFSHPRVGRWSLQPEYQKHIQRIHTQCIEYRQPDDWIIREYKLCNKRHNVDGPAIEVLDGTKMWYQHGLLHRSDDLPALEQSCGSKGWWLCGKLHRDNDLPAIKWSDGTRMWHRYGKLHRDNDLPAYEGKDGTKKWYQNGLLHRDGDSPAVEKSDGTKEWWVNGKRHRDNNLPAVEKCEWWTGGNNNIY